MNRFILGSCLCVLAVMQGVASNLAYFEANLGQAPSDIKFLSRNGDAQLLIAPQGVSINYFYGPTGEKRESPKPRQSATLQMSLHGASKTAPGKGCSPCQAKSTTS